MNYNEEDPENLGRQSDQQSFAEFLKLLKDEFGELLRTRLLNDRIVNYFNGATIHNLVINGNMNKGGTEYYEADSRVQEEPQPMVVRRPTDDMIIEGVRRCQAFFWAGAAWAVVYRVLQSDYDESRSVNQFEEDMFLPSEGLNYRCSPRTIAMGMQNNTVLRSKPEAWEQEGAKSRILTLRDAFRGVLKELL